MITVKNQTERVIVVYNRSFSVDIPIGKTVEIEQDQLGGDSKLFCRYFSDRGEEVTLDYGVKESGWLGRSKVTLYYENESTFPLVTAFDAEEGQDICLEEEFVSLRILLIKSVRLRKLTQTKKKAGTKEEYLFQEEKSKKRFLKLMRISALLLPLAVILSLAGVFSLFSPDFSIVQKAAAVIACAFISWFLFEDGYYYFAARKWKTLS